MFPTYFVLAFIESSMLESERLRRLDAWLARFRTIYATIWPQSMRMRSFWHRHAPIQRSGRVVCEIRLA